MAELGNYKILIADDNSANLELLNGILFEQGYIVYIAKNGQQALQQAIDKHPDMVILDVNMPDMNGFDVCREIKSIPEIDDILVIFLSAQVQQEDVTHGLSLGAVDYISKPFDVDEITSRINNHLVLKRQTDISASISKGAQSLVENQNVFFSKVTHSIQKPISAAEDILNNLLSNYQLPPEMELREILEDVRRNVKYTSESLEKIDYHIRIMNNQLIADNRRFDVNPIINSNVRHFAKIAKEKGITLLYENPQSRYVIADLKLVDMVIKNLVSNAVKYTEKGGDIIISTQSDENFVTIVVYDTGKGMAPEVADHVFDTDINKIINQEGDSVGLGLGIAAQFVKLCGGKIWVESMTNIGSDFKFTLPIG